METFKEDSFGNLVLDDNVIVPAEKRTKCEVFSRVVGYMRPVQHWNKGKHQEFVERKEFKTE